MPKHFEIAVLGGGPGGYVAAIRSAQLGFKTAIIEKDNLGGICLNWGCIPTKALLKSAEIMETIKRSAEYGINIETYSFDFKKVIKRNRDVADRISKNVEYLMKKNKIERIKGFGKFTNNGSIDVLNENNEIIDTVNYEKVIIATGARSRPIPSIPIDKKQIITSTEALLLDELPGEIAIIGAGAIGVEFAYFYNSFGAKVTLIEAMDNILPLEDKEISNALTKEFKKRGIEIHVKTKVEKTEVKEGKAEVCISKDGEESVIKADIALVAIGVVGNVEGFGLEDLGVETNKNMIVVDKSTYKTNVNNIYAIGDVIGPPWLAHVASAEGIHCIERIKGLDSPPVDYNSIPGCTYCQPQVASVGLTEEKARKEGYDIKVGKFPFTASGKAFATGEREGFVKLIFDAKYDELIGAHIIGAEATELIAEITLAKTMEATYKSIIKTVHAHPTLSESIMEAAANAYGESIHI